MSTRPRLLAVITLAALALTLTGCDQGTGGGSGGGGGGKPNPQAGGGGLPSTAITAGNIIILDTRTDLTDRARAKQNVEDTLTKYPDVGCLVGLWSYNTPAIVSAVTDADKTGKVKIVGFDEEDDTLQGVKDGSIHATVVQQPYQFGYMSVKTLAALAQGDKSAVPENGIIDVPVQIIRPDNVEAFWDQLKQQRAGGGDPETGAAAEDTIKIAFVTNNASDFWQIAKAGVNEALKELGNVQCDFRMPADGTPAQQQEIVEALIAKKVSGMAISPNDAENQTEMLNRAAEAMNVICHDSDAPKSNRLAYVGTNNYLAGREAGKLIKEALPEGGKVMLFVGRLDAQNAIERRQGIIDELEGKPAPK